MRELLVTGLWTYPVKGMAGNPVASLRFDKSGPVDDRRWMLVDAQGQFMSQRKTPVLGLFHASLLGQQLRITAPDGEQCPVNPEDCTQDAEVTVWHDTVQVSVAPQAVNQWLGHYLDTPVRLVRYRTDAPRAVNAQWARGQVGFADGFPLLVCHEESLQALNQNAPVPLEMARFRPNVVVSGGEPWAEHDWVALESDQHRLDLVKPCERCAVVTLRPGTEERTPTVLRHILAHNAIGGKPVFGVNAMAGLAESPLMLGEIMRPVACSTQRVSAT